MQSNLVYFLQSCCSIFQTLNDLDFNLRKFKIMYLMMLEIKTRKLTLNVFETKNKSQKCGQQTRKKRAKQEGKYEITMERR